MPKRNSNLFVTEPGRSKSQKLTDLFHRVPAGAYRQVVDVQTNALAQTIIQASGGAGATSVQLSSGSLTASLRFAPDEPAVGHAVAAPVVAPAAAPVEEDAPVVAQQAIDKVDVHVNECPERGYAIEDVSDEEDESVIHPGVPCTTVEESTGEVDDAPEQQPSGTTGDRLPSMTQRSRAEVTCLAHLLKAIRGKCTLEMLYEAMRLGDQMFKTDGVIKCANQTIAYEYDEGTFHRTTDIPRDVRKTEKLLAHDPDLRVLRIRIDAPPLPDHILSNPRVIVVNVESRNVMTIVAAAAFALKDLLPDPFSKRLTNLGEKPSRSKSVDSVVHACFMRLDSAYKSELDTVKALVGDEAIARRVLSAHGVKSRLASGSIADGIRRLHAMGIRGKKLATLLSDSVAARLGEDVFWAGLVRLRGEFGITSNMLPTFLSGSVAARLGEDVFWAGLVRLRDEFGCNSAILLVSRCGGSFTSRITKTEFCSALIMMSKHMMVHGIEAVDSIAKLLHTDAKLMDRVDKLVALIVACTNKAAITSVLRRFKHGAGRKAAVAAL